MFRKSLVILCIVLMVAVGLVGCSTSAKAPAADPASKYPERQIEVMVGYAAGSGTDINVRSFAPPLSKALNGTVVVNNKPGASGGLGFNYVANAKPDGYTLGFANFSSVVATTEMSDVGVDVMKDLKFIGAILTDDYVFLTSADSKFNTLKEAVEYAKKNPNAVRFGASGPTSIDAMLCYNIEQVGGVDLNLVPFQGSGELQVAALGGHIDMYNTALADAKSNVKAGKLKILGIGGDKRNPEFPDVPTFAEQGYPLTFDSTERGFFVPSDTDPAIIAKLEAAIKKAVEDPEFVQKWTTAGMKVELISAEQCQKDVAGFYDWFLNNKSKIKIDK